MKERLQKLLAQANVATSRRAAEALIEQRRVRVNGTIARLGDKADPETDVIQVDNAALKFERAKKIYIALNKPKHVLTTTEPHKGDPRQTVYDLVGIKENLFSIGRLDADSEGLMVLTNDGDLAQRLTHPRYRHSKTYKVDVDGLPGMDVLDKWRNGIVLDEDEKTSPCVVELINGDKKLSTLRIIMTEGRKRQIRRVGMKLEHRVRRLVRTHIGLLPIGELRPGEWRELTPKDLDLLRTPAPELRILKRRIAPKRGTGKTASVGAASETSAPRRPRRAGESGDTTGEQRRPRARLVDDEFEPGDRPTPTRPSAARPSSTRPSAARPSSSRSSRPAPKYAVTAPAEERDSGESPVPKRRKPIRPGGDFSKSGKAGEDAPRRPIRRKPTRAAGDAERQTERSSDSREDAPRGRNRPSASPAGSGASRPARPGAPKSRTPKRTRGDSERSGERSSDRSPDRSSEDAPRGRNRPGASPAGSGSSRPARPGAPKRQTPKRKTGDSARPESAPRRPGRTLRRKPKDRP